ncbi:MAG: WYL domain-containing protein [Planctomycetes bacterium]|nr:WYL domain-containing protein [Planctomycetota bacterium]
MERVKVTKTERLLNLISFMLRSPQPVPFSLIAGHVVGYDDEARLDSIEKRFDRDKAELRNMGIPVEYYDSGSPENSGYLIPRDKFFLGRLQLDGGDALLLSLAGRVGTIAFAAPSMKGAFQSALRKLAVDLPEIGDLPAESASMLQVSSGLQRASDVLPVICSAVFGRRRIRFGYAGRKDAKPLKRHVEPYGLGVSDGEWYVVGRDLERDAVRMFKLARIAKTVTFSGASDSGPEFEIPQDFRISERLHRNAWEFGEGETVRVSVCLPRVMGEHLSRQHRATIESTTEHEVVLAFDAANPTTLVDQIFSLGPEAKITGPAELVRAAADRLDEMLARYDTGDRAEAGE